MRPSISVSLEPGLDRGVPWGRDLYTFVTSAAGHMMRTLQKPRKNRPSKRQVNHRRFLHNMIQRKFADIEASNHRLASVLNFKESDKHSSSSPSSHKPESPDPTGNPPQTGPEPHKHHQVGEKNQPDSGLLWKRDPKPEPGPGPDRTRNQDQDLRDPLDSDSNQEVELVDPDFQPISSFSEAPPPPPDGSGPLGSPSFGPELSPPLSLDSCDLSVQVFSELAEDQLTDLLELLAGPDAGGWVDVETYLEGICGCHGDAGPDDQSEGVVVDGGKYGYGCHGDQLPSICSPSTEEEEFSDNLPASVRSQCMMGSGGVGFAPFEGVAQSFSAPIQTPGLRLVATPPPEDDWLFSDIMKDGESTEY